MKALLGTGALTIAGDRPATLTTEKGKTFMARMAIETAKDENGDRTYPTRAPQGHQIGRWWNGYNYESNPNAEALARFDAQDKRGGAGV